MAATDTCEIDDEDCERRKQVCDCILHDIRCLYPGKWKVISYCKEIRCTFVYFQLPTVPVKKKYRDVAP